MKIDEIPHYWINLTYRKDRRDNMLNQLKKKTHIRINPKKEEYALLSCIKSHFEAILTAYHDNVEYALFFEDDVLNVDELASSTLFMDLINDKYNDTQWDIVQLHYICSTFIDTLITLREEGVEEFLHQRLVKGYFMSAAAYVMSRKGIVNFIEKMGKKVGNTYELNVYYSNIDLVTPEEFLYAYLNSYFLLYPIIETIENNTSDVGHLEYTKKYNLDNMISLKNLREKVDIRSLSIDEKILKMFPPNCHWYLDAKLCKTMCLETAQRYRNEGKELKIESLPKKTRILFYGTYPDQTNGYARSANIITNYLAQQENVEVFFFGISRYFIEGVKRFIDPRITLINALEETAGKDAFGYELLPKKILELKPDIVFLYNDILVLHDLLIKITHLKPLFKLYFYMDLVYEFEKIDIIQFLNSYADKIFVFSDCWKNNLIHLQIDPSKIYPLPLGLDTKTFYPLDTKEARIKLNLNENDFIILNTNRNTNRKCLDLTIASFLRFYKLVPKNDRSKLKLLINSYETESTSYDMKAIIEIECIKLHIDPNKILTQNYLETLNKGGFIPDDGVNLLYNACDIGINTCNGEGFGLCNQEHAGVGKPQVVPKVGALSDIFKFFPSMLVLPKVKIYASTHYVHHEGYLEFVDPNDVAATLFKFYNNSKLRESEGKLAREYILNTYNWDKILKQFVSDFNS